MSSESNSDLVIRADPGQTRIESIAAESGPIGLAESEA